MKSYNRIQSLLLTLSAILSTTVMAVPQAKAVSFQEQQLNQEQFAVLAVPFGYQEHRLEIIEQISGKQKCWQESGVAPVEVDLLFLNFDHTDSCRRIINTNGYTLRLNGQDERVAHVIKIVENNGELQLVAFHKNPAQPNIVIGKTNGLRNGAMKIILNPGWQITKRVHQGQVIDHFYLSGNPGRYQTGYSSTSSTTIKGNNSSSTSTSSTITQGTTAINSTNANTNGTNTNPPTTPTGSNVDTKALVNSVEQIYNNVVTPLLYDLSQQNSNNQ